MAKDSAALQVRPGQARKFALGLAEVAGAERIAIVMANAAQAQQACQQIELSELAVILAKMNVAEAAGLAGA